MSAASQQISILSFNWQAENWSYFGWVIFVAVVKLTWVFKIEFSCLFDAVCVSSESIMGFYRDGKSNYLMWQTKVKDF